jgi:hypothetical protein
MTHQELKDFGVYLLNQENIRKSHNSGIIALTIEQIAEYHTDNYLLAPVIEEVVGQEETHILTEEDFVNNPELSEVMDEDGEPLQPGDEIVIQA